MTARFAAIFDPTSVEAGTGAVCAIQRAPPSSEVDDAESDVIAMKNASAQGNAPAIMPARASRSAPGTLTAEARICGPATAAAMAATRASAGPAAVFMR